MIIGKKCSVCKGKGFWIGGGFIRKNCGSCAGSGMDDTPGEHIMSKMLGSQTIGQNRKEDHSVIIKQNAEAKLDKMKDQTSEEVKKSLSEMSLDELKSVMPKKRGRPKNDKKENVSQEKNDGEQNNVKHTENVNTEEALDQSASDNG